MTGVDGDDNNDNANTLMSTSPHLLPLIPGAPLPIVIHGALDMGRRLLPLAVAAAPGKALTCPPEFLDLDFPEVGVAMTGVDGDDDDNNGNAPTSTSPHPLPLIPGAPLPIVVHVDMGRRLLPLAVAAVLGKALTCPPKFFNLDFPEVGAAMMGVDGDDDDNNDANAPTSTSPGMLPLIPGAPLPVVIHSVLATLV